MHTWIIATTTAVAGLAIGALFGITTTALVAKTLATALVRVALRDFGIDADVDDPELEDDEDAAEPAEAAV
jgi:hypothetical protein